MLPASPVDVATVSHSLKPKQIAAPASRHTYPPVPLVSSTKHLELARVADEVRCRHGVKSRKVSDEVSDGHLMGMDGQEFHVGTVNTNEQDTFPTSMPIVIIQCFLMDCLPTGM
jgi:hypothetical protein